MGTFTIKQKCFDGIELVGYIIEDDTGKKSKIKKIDAMTLIYKGIVTNGKRILDSDVGEYTICITEDIPKEEKQKLEVIGRTIGKNGECTGYIVRDSQGNNHRLNNKNTWIKAINNEVSNLTAKVIGGKKVLLSNSNRRLSDMPTIVDS